MNKKTASKSDFDWQSHFRGMLVTAAEAAAHVKPGDRVFVGTGCAQPLALINALVARAGELRDTEFVHLLTFGDAPYASPDLSAHFSVNSFFIAENVRGLIQEGLGDYTPIYLSEIPHLLTSGELPLDVALIQVSPPDENGFCSLGISVDIVKCAAENARIVIAQVNEQMPRTLGDSSLHVYDIDYLVPVNQPLIELAPIETNAVTRDIGHHIASLIEDGSTLELGIGRVTQAVFECLLEKRGIGIHTEMFTDQIIPLIEAGVVTGEHKTLDKGKIVASFCIGTQKLYDYVHNNPLFDFHPTEYVNDPHIIAQQYRMVAINVALEVDLTGQICADSLGTQFHSGIGGQVDFNRGAARGRNGKAIIALPSTAKGGTVSCIVTTLAKGAGVVTTRGGVHYVVTEYGVAYLHGKTVQERALALISIAHPDHRERLLREAIAVKYVRAELADYGGRIVVGPKEMRTTCLLANGAQVTIRPIHPTDEPHLRELFYDLSKQSLYTRFMSMVKWVSRKQVREFIYIDHRTEVSIVATLPAADGEDIIAIGGYYLDAKSNRAEVAFTVADEWQNHGIGSFLFTHLAAIARRNGIAGFTAEILAENKPMQAVFHNSGFKVRSQTHQGVVHLDIDFN